MIAIMISLSIFLMYIRKRRCVSDVKLITVILLGICLIIIQVAILEMRYNVAFVGSDAYKYYEYAKYDKFTDIVNMLKIEHGNSYIKYIGYTMVNYLSNIPNLGIDMASISQKISCLLMLLILYVEMKYTIYIITIDKEKKRNRSYKIFEYAILIFIYWSSVVNFRDGLISVIFTLLILEAFYKENISVIKVIFLILLLLLFRNELIVIFIIAYLIWLILKQMNIKNKMFGTIIIISLLFTVWYFIPLVEPLRDFIIPEPNEVAKSTYTEMYNIANNNPDLAGKIFSKKYIVESIKSLVYSNPLQNIFLTVTNGYKYGWIMTMPHQIINIGFGIVNYFIILPYISMLVFYNKKMLINLNDKMKKFIELIFINCFIVFAVYNVRWGFQERNRLTIYMIILFAFLINFSVIEYSWFKIKYKKMLCFWWCIALSHLLYYILLKVI